MAYPNMPKTQIRWTLYLRTRSCLGVSSHNKQYLPFAEKNFYEIIFLFIIAVKGNNQMHARYCGIKVNSSLSGIQTMYQKYLNTVCISTLLRFPKQTKWAAQLLILECKVYHHHRGDHVSYCHCHSAATLAFKQI